MHKQFNQEPLAPPSSLSFLQSYTIAYGWNRPDLSPVLAAIRLSPICKLLQPPCAFIHDHNSKSPILRLCILERFPGPRHSTNSISLFSPITDYSSLLHPPWNLNSFSINHNNNQIVPWNTNRRVTHGENSPSLCPTISSVIVISLYIFPLCTWNLSPTKLGRIVAPRACVLIGGVRSPGLGVMMGRLE